MYAIVEAGGKQYKLEEGRYVDMELLHANENDKVTFDKVVMLVNGKKSKVGQPYVEGAVVEGSIVKNDKAKKIIVFKMKPKKNYRRKQGHRQPYTKVEITSIKLATEKAEKTEKAEAPAKKPAAKVEE